jgi:hypothetical protein
VGWRVPERPATPENRPGGRQLPLFYELGWCREEFKKIGVEYAYFRHGRTST